MYTVAIIVSTVGFHWEEVFDAYQVFNDASWVVDFYTVDGKPPVPDPNSVKTRPLLSSVGLGVKKSFSPQSSLGEKLSVKLNTQIRPIHELEMNNTDVIYIPGGHGCLFDVNVNETVHAKLAEAYQQNKIIGAVCHGTSCLALTKINGVSIIKGKRVIGFLDSMDTFLQRLNLIDKKFLPLPYPNEKAIRDAGGLITPINFTLGFLQPSYYVVDVPFITGVGPKATTNVATKMVNLTEERVR